VTFSKNLHFLKKLCLKQLHIKNTTSLILFVPWPTENKIKIHGFWFFQFFLKANYKYDTWWQNKLLQTGHTFKNVNFLKTSLFNFFRIYLFLNKSMQKVDNGICTIPIKTDNYWQQTHPTVTWLRVLSRQIIINNRRTLVSHD
jgi:hypothetical protein